MASRFSRPLGAHAVAISVVAILGLLAVAKRSAAQQPDSSNAEVVRSLDSLIIDAAAIASRIPSTAQMVQSTLRAQPGNSVGSESAWGAGWADFFVGAGYQERGRFSSKPDGSLSFGFGLGNPQRDIGMEVGINSASTLRQIPGRNGSVSVKLHRVLPGAYGIAVGVENGASWGGTDGGSSTYGAVSHTHKMRDDPSWFLGSIAWNIGIGNSRFLSQDDLARGKRGVNVFGSAGLRLAARASLVGDWTGQDLDAGLSLVPFHRSPLVLSLGLADLTHRAGDGARLIVGLGAGFRVLDLLATQGR